MNRMGRVPPEATTSRAHESTSLTSFTPLEIAVLSCSEKTPNVTLAAARKKEDDLKSREGQGKQAVESSHNDSAGLKNH